MKIKLITIPKWIPALLLLSLLLSLGTGCASRIVKSPQIIYAQTPIQNTGSFLVKEKQPEQDSKMERSDDTAWFSGQKTSKARRYVLLDYAHRIADELSRHATEFEPSDINIIVTTFTDVNQYKTTLNFGRSLTESLISALQQKDFHVMEICKTKQIYIKEKNGLYQISRKLDEINDKVKFHASLLGTYSIAYDRVIVNARLVDSQKDTVISTSDIEIPIDKNIQHLLTNIKKAETKDDKIYLMEQGLEQTSDEYSVSVLERHFEKRQ